MVTPPGRGNTGEPGSTGAPEPVLVDARGLLCPVPVLRLAEAAHDTADGTVLEIMWTDPAAAYDVPAWVQMRGHVLLDEVPPPPVTAWGAMLPDAEPGRARIRVVRA